MLGWNKLINCYISDINKKSPSTKKALPNDFDAAVIIPAPDKATQIARLFLTQDKPSCLLIPIDLYPFITQNDDKTFSTQINKALNNSTKI